MSDEPKNECVCGHPFSLHGSDGCHVAWCVCQRVHRPIVSDEPKEIWVVERYNNHLRVDGLYAWTLVQNGTFTREDHAEKFAELAELNITPAPTMKHYRVRRYIPDTVVAELVDALEKARDFIERVENWAKAYPLEVFPEPDMKKVREALWDRDITIDCVSASNMRHVATTLAREAVPARNAIDAALLHTTSKTTEKP